jgi:nucleoside-diphosphate-sugar epimerase
MMQLHTVLGATGPIGTVIVGELAARNLEIRVVERTKDFPGRHTVKADLRDPAQTAAAIEGSTHVYLCVGLPYNSAVWERDWPKIMSSVIAACKANGAVLVFVDNVYMYGPTPLAVPFDESHRQQPTSRKGRVRLHIANELMNALTSGSVRGVIGRSADFYGPYSRNSVTYISVIERVLNGKAPQSLFPVDVPHSYAYVVDVGRALVELALDESTYGQVWHLPVSETATLSQIVQIVNTSLGTHYRIGILPTVLRKFLALFISPLKEMDEMLYQFTEPYVMSDRKFRNKFPHFAATTIENGLRASLDYFQTEHQKRSPGPGA